MSPTRHYQLQGFEVAAARYPFTGVGVGDFYSRNTALAPGAWSPHEIHNTYLGVWAETGIVGVVGLFLFLLAAIQAGWQVVANARDRELAGLALALLVSWLVLMAYGVSAFELRTRHLWVVFAFLFVSWNVMWRESARLNPLRAEALPGRASDRTSAPDETPRGGRTPEDPDRPR